MVVMVTAMAKVVSMDAMLATPVTVVVMAIHMDNETPQTAHGSQVCGDPVEAHKPTPNKSNTVIIIGHHH